MALHICTHRFEELKSSGKILEVCTNFCLNLAVACSDLQRTGYQVCVCVCVCVGGGGGGGGGGGEDGSTANQCGRRGYVLTWVMECGHLYVVSSALGGGVGVGSLQAGPHHGGGARRRHQVT